MLDKYVFPRKTEQEACLESTFAGTEMQSKP